MKARIGLALVIAGCGGPPEVGTSASSAELGTTEAPGRPLRRMDIDQLSASMLQVTGGVGWTEVQEVETDSGVGAEEVDLFERLSLTLGKPDYLDSTTEDLAPGLLFQKFLDDAAKSTCSALVVAEQERAAGERVLLVHVEADTTATSDRAAVDANLSAALLRWHGRVIATDDPRLDPWRTLFSDVTDRTGDPVEGWRAVCVALFTHPDFYSY